MTDYIIACPCFDTYLLPFFLNVVLENVKKKIPVAGGKTPVKMDKCKREFDFYCREGMRLPRYSETQGLK